MSDAPRTIPIDRIRTDGDTQPRQSMNAEAVREYTARLEEGDKFPPVDVYFDGESYWLADGFHRIAAFRELGRKALLATVHKGTVRDAILHAVEANAHQGQRFTNADKRRVVTLLLSDEEWCRWSDREVARRCAVSHTFVSEIRRALATVASPEGPEAGVGVATVATPTGGAEGSPVATVASGEADSAGDEVATVATPEDETDGEAATEAEASAEPEAPFAAFNAGIDRIVSHLGSAAAEMRRVYGVSKGENGEQEFTNPYALRSFNHLTTISDVNHLIRLQKEGRVVRQLPDGSFVTEGDIKSRRAAS